MESTKGRWLVGTANKRTESGPLAVISRSLHVIHCQYPGSAISKSIVKLPITLQPMCLCFWGSCHISSLLSKIIVIMFHTHKVATPNRSLLKELIRFPWTTCNAGLLMGVISDRKRKTQSVLWARSRLGYRVLQVCWNPNFILWTYAQVCLLACVYSFFFKIRSGILLLLSNSPESMTITFLIIKYWLYNIHFLQAKVKSD